MRRVYQRVRGLAASTPRAKRIAGALVLLAAVACRPAAEAPAAEPGAPPDAADLHLASRAYELVDVGARPPRLLADEHSPEGVRAIEIAVAGGGPLALAPARGESRAVAAFPGDERALVELFVPGESGPRLHVRVAGGQLRPLPAPAPAGERFLGWLRDGAAFATAGLRDASGGESLFEIDARSLVRRELDRAEPTFRVAAVDGDARLVALVRRLDDEADELVLRDRRRDESRLLLPSDDDGRFRPHLFLPDGDLLLSADDGSDLSRLERLSPLTGRRRPFAPLPCPAESARLDGAGGVVVELACDGRREAVRIALDGMPTPLPAVPAGTRALRLLQGGDEAPTVVGYGGARWPPDLAVLDARGLAEPRTYGLAPRLPPGTGAAVELVGVSSGSVALPCELRLPAGSPAGGVVRFEDPARPARFDEHRPMPAALASRGLAVLSCRGRGSDGFGRALRRGADGDPAGAALADLRAAAASLRARLPRGAAFALAGEGAWWGAAALALAGEESLGAAVVLALFPEPDPLAPLAALAALADAAPANATQGPPLDPRWGDPTRPELASRVEAWRFPVAAARMPTLIALDVEAPATAELLARVEAAAAAGAPVAALRGRRSRVTGEPLGELARALAAALGEAAAGR